MRRRLVVVRSVLLGGGLAVGTVILVGQCIDISIPRFRTPTPTTPEIPETPLSEKGSISLVWPRIRQADKDFHSDRCGYCDQPPIQECDPEKNREHSMTGFQAYADSLPVVQAIPRQPETRRLMTNMATYVNLRTKQWGSQHLAWDLSTGREGGNVRAGDTFDWWNR